MSKANKQCEQQQEVAQSCRKGGRGGATAPLKVPIGFEISPVDSWNCVHLTSAFLVFFLLLSADEDARWWIVMSRWDKYVSVRLVANARPPAIAPRPGRILLHPSGRRNQHGATLALCKNVDEKLRLFWSWFSLQRWRLSFSSLLTLTCLLLLCFPVNTWTCLCHGLFWAQTFHFSEVTLPYKGRSVRRCLTYSSCAAAGFRDPSGGRIYAHCWKHKFTW